MTAPDAPPPPRVAGPGGAALVIGAVMALLGLFIAARALLTDAPPLTGTLALDLAFAVFFVARGALAYARYKRSRDAAAR